MPGIILAASGGLDSTVLISHAAKLAGKVVCVNFKYGSTHNKYEGQAYKDLSRHFLTSDNIELHPWRVDLSEVLGKSNSALTSKENIIPEGHYEEASMKRTIVPGRNLMFISALAALAESLGCTQVWVGAHAGDHFIYPDCRPEFIKAANEVVRFSSDGAVMVAAPFKNKTKADIVKLGIEYKTPFHITRTCYKDQAIACGKCGSCQERLEAFARNGMVDPIDYISRTITPKGT